MSLEKETAHHHDSLEKVKQLEAVVSCQRSSLVAEEERTAATRSSLKDAEENSTALGGKLQT